jgi:hypothetical protein
MRSTSSSVISSPERTPFITVCGTLYYLFLRAGHIAAANDN